MDARDFDGVLLFTLLLRRAVYASLSSTSITSQAASEHIFSQSYKSYSIILSYLLHSYVRSGLKRLQERRRSATMPSRCRLRRQDAEIESCGTETSVDWPPECTTSLTRACFRPAREAHVSQRRSSFLGLSTSIWQGLSLAHSHLKKSIRIHWPRHLPAFEAGLAARGAMTKRG